MKVHVFPGQVVIIYCRYAKDKTEKSFPSLVLVQRTQRGALMVSEGESINGLANIVCHGDSSSGRYWYEYTTAVKRYDADQNIHFEYQNRSFDITRLEDREGKPIKVSAFIED